MAKDESFFDMKGVEKQWCPGCGHIALHKILCQALAEIDFDPLKLVFVSGIGQAAKLPQYTVGHMFNGLHGRSLPAAMAINAANPELKIIVDSGDGCSYGEGGNHFMHQILRNPDITNIVHNNQIYGLTKNQASPTTLKGMKTTVQVFGVTNEPLNPLAVAIALGATFVARASVGDVEKTKEILKRAISHKGYALVDVFTPCVSFNKLNTYKWYKEHTYYLEESHDFHDRKVAFARALEVDRLPLGTFYVDESKPVFWEESVAYRKQKTPLYQRRLNRTQLKNLIESMK
jgi:2-oxoglutarate ferredoxin oxidoreductase subunit beta